MTVPATLLLVWLGSAATMALLWAAQLRTRNAGIVDAGWSACLGGAAVASAFLGEGAVERRFLVGALGGVWGARLAWHLLVDRVLGRPEEGRYVTLRGNWSPHADRAFFVFYQFQALSVGILALPFALASADTETPLRLADWAALVLWGAGWSGEAVADRQLRAFKAERRNRGRTCRSGLWAVSRHPNYFFEWVQWCAFALLASGAAWGWLGWLAPLAILYLVLFVTGIPPTEAQAVKSRGDDYRRYQAEVSPFVPWFPKRRSE